MKTVLVLFGFIIILISGCVNEKIVDLNNSENGSISISIDKKNAPEDVSEVIVDIEREGYETKQISLNMVSDTSAVLSIDKLASGFWHLTVRALNVDGVVLYFGETNVNVQPNSVIPITLQLNPSTGSILLYVTWGGTTSKDLVAYYPFSGNADDYSGLNNNGIVNGAVPTEDRFGNKNSAYYFDGVDDYIRIPDDNSLTPSHQKISIAVWINVDNARDKYVLYKGSTQYNREYAVGIRKDSLASFHINDHGMWDSGQIGLASRTTINNGIWYFLVCTWDGRLLKLYVNGSLENALLTDAVIDNLDSDLFIGTYGGKISQYAFHGIIDDLRIFNYVISNKKVKELYHENGWDIKFN